MALGSRELLLEMFVAFWGGGGGALGGRARRISVTGMTDSLVWLYWCRVLTLQRWRQECRLVEEWFSLFRAFAEPPFLGFRGVVARAGCEYQVTVAAEMDFYPQYLPWAFVTPCVAGAREDGKLSLDLAWDGKASRFVDVIGAVIRQIERVHRTAHLR